MSRGHKQGVKLPEEQKKHISEGLKRFYSTHKGVASFLGKHHTEQFKLEASNDRRKLYKSIQKGNVREKYLGLGKKQKRQN